MKEVWKQFEDTIYSVSSTGAVRRELRVINQFPGGTGGYMMVNIYHKGDNRLLAVHRIVAQTFLPNPELKRTVNHKNGNKLDNNVENLEWSTYSENLKHAVDTGLTQRGSTKVNAKLNELQVEEIKLMLASGRTNTDIAMKYNVHCATISEIRQGRTWKHVRPDLVWNVVSSPVATNKKLSAQDIPVIRELISAKRSDAEIGALYRVARGTIQGIRAGKPGVIINKPV